MTESSLHPTDTMSVPERPFSRVARSVAGYGVVTALMLITPLLVFAPAALFHCAMRNNRIAAWSAALVATGLAGLYFAEVANTSALADARLAYTSYIGIVLSVVVPSIAALPLVQQRRKFGTVLMFALIVSAAGLVLTEFVMRSMSFSPYAMQVQQMSATASQIATMVKQNGVRDSQLWLLNRVSMLVPAMAIFQVGLVFVLSLMMYGRLSAWRAFALRGADRATMRQTYLFRNLQLPEWVLFLFVAGGLTPLLTGIWQLIAANVLTVVFCLYLLQGLAIFRAILVRTGAGWVGSLLGFFILAMLCLTGIGLVLLAGAGLFDPFVDFRKLNRKDDSHESHTD